MKGRREEIRRELEKGKYKTKDNGRNRKEETRVYEKEQRKRKKEENRKSKRRRRRGTPFIIPSFTGGLKERWIIS